VADVPDPVIHFMLEECKGDEQFRNRHPHIKGDILAHIMVKDNGSGISDEDKKHIFEPFYTTKEVGVGTGLGLAMCYGSIQSHGGLIEVESMPGEGSAFHVYLPLKDEKELIVSDETSGKPLAGKGETILVVDDNAFVRRTTEELLKNLGYHVLEASDGLEAVDVFVANQNDIALVIMDIVMPRLGGVKAVERMRRACPELKVIYATGYDKDETLGKETPLDDDIIISKPYAMGALSEAIRTLLDA